MHTPSILARFLSNSSIVALLMAAAVTAPPSSASDTTGKTKPKYFYVFTELGTFGDPSAESFARGINNAGQVVGTSAYQRAESGHIAFWDNGKIKDFGIGGGTGINDKGQIIAAGPSGPQVIINGRVTVLPGLGGADTTLSAINNTGLIIGSSTVPGSSTRHAILWQGMKPIDLGAGNQANAVNERGQIAGSVAGRPVIWNGTKPTYLDKSGVALGINDRGDAVGIGSKGPTLWKDGRTVSLPNLRTDSGEFTSIPLAINNAGVIVGYSSAPSLSLYDFATVWVDGKAQALNGMFDKSGLRPMGLTRAYAINDCGQIVGDIDTAHAFLLTPADSKGCRGAASSK